MIFHPLKGELHAFSSIERRVTCFFIHLPTKLLVTVNRLVLLCDHTPRLLTWVLLHGLGFRV